jgi:hypothetical protein
MAKVEIFGIDALREELKAFPAKFQTTVVNKGVRKASATLRTALRRAAYAAPLAKGYKRTNKLRYSLRAYVGKKAQTKGKAWVGLKRLPGPKTRTLSYYKTLEFGRNAYTSKKRGTVKGSPPLRPFFDRGWNASKINVGRILVDETRKALAYEAGKALGRSKGRR